MTRIGACVVLLTTLIVGVLVGRRFGAAKGTMAAGAALLGAFGLLILLVALAVGHMD